MGGVRFYVKGTRMIDKGYKNICQEVRNLNTSYTKVGFPEDGTVQPARKKGSGHEAFSGMSEIAYIASIMEYGNDSPVPIPPRPFMKMAFDKNRQELRTVREKYLKSVLDNRMTAQRALGLIGEWFAGTIKRTIRDGKFEANAPYTIAKKGSDKPLIDTGQMLNSVQHVEVMR